MGPLIRRVKVDLASALFLSGGGGLAICPAMAVVMRLISLILIVAALMLLGADAVTSLERGGELTVRSLGTIWGLIHQHSLDEFKSWVQNHLPFMAQGIYSALALPGWAATGVLGVILAFIFGRKLGPE
jgi:ABC-type nickel/cobalt efflux system permease component RcnA